MTTTTKSVSFRISREEHRRLRRAYERDREPEESFSEWLRRRVSGGQANTSAECPLLGVKQVIRMLGCSRTTLFRLVRDGRIVPPTRLGGRVVWSEPRLMEWIKGDNPSYAE